MALIYIAVKRTLKEKNPAKQLNIFIWLGLVTALFGFWQFAGDMAGISQKFTFLSDLYVKNLFGFPRIQSTFFEPGFFANFLLIPLYLSIYFLFQTNKLFYKISLVIICLAFFLTLSRGGIIAFVITFGLFSFIYLAKNFKKIRALTVPVSLIIISFIFCQVVIFSFTGFAGVKTYFGQIKNSGDVKAVTVENVEKKTRAYTVKVALDNWKKHPISGIGTGAFGTLPEFEKNREKGNLRQTVNSLYPEIMVEEGVIGLLLLLTFLGSIILKLYKSKDNFILNLIFIAAVIAVFLQYISFSTLYLVYIWVFLGITMAKRPLQSQN